MSSSSGLTVPRRTLVLLDPKDEVTSLCEISRTTFPGIHCHISEEWWLVTDSVKSKIYHRTNVDSPVRYSSHEEVYRSLTVAEQRQ
jgi:hypothetical protein